MQTTIYCGVSTNDWNIVGYYVDDGISGKKYITYQCNGHNNNCCNAPGFSHIKIENAFSFEPTIQASKLSSLRDKSLYEEEIDNLKERLENIDSEYEEKISDIHQEHENEKQEKIIFTATRQNMLQEKSRKKSYSQRKNISALI